MSNFIKNVKQHKVAALISFAVLAVLIVVLVLVMKKGGGSDDELSLPDSDGGKASQLSEQSYFENSGYPVKVVLSGKELRIELDGSKSPDSEWTVVSDDTEGEVLKTETDGEEKDSKLSVVGTPVSIGYAMLTFTRSGEVKGLAYNAVTIEADISVTSDDDGNLKAAVSDIRQSTSNAGALDTETPFLLDGNTVILPAGGDWVLTPYNENGNIPYGLITVYDGEESDGMKYFVVEKDVSAAISLEPEDAFKALNDSKVLLISEELGVEQLLDLKKSGDRWVLSISDQATKKSLLQDASDDTESADDTDSSTEESSSDNE